MFIIKFLRFKDKQEKINYVYWESRDVCLSASISAMSFLACASSFVPCSGLKSYRFVS